MNKALDKKIYFLYLGLFFLAAVLPLLSAPPLLHPASFAKSTIFKIIFSLIILLFIFELFFVSKKYWSKLRKALKSNVKIPLILLLLFGLMYILSSLFSLDPHLSFWGNPLRGGATITIIMLIIFSILAFLIIREKDWQRLWDFSLIIGILVSLVAIIQKLELFPKLFTPQPYRPFSTMGGAAFLAMYSLLLIFLALSFGLEKIQRKSIFYFAGAGFLVIAVFLSATRSGFLGLFAGILFFSLFYPKKDKKVLALKITIIVLTLLSLLGAFWLKEIPFLGTAFERVWEITGPIIESKQISFEKIVSRGRYSGWQVLWLAVDDRPILGYGPENLSIAFDKYYDPSVPGITSETMGSGWWDRAHNIFLETAITIGIPGLIIYLLLFGFLFYKLQRIKKDPEKKVIATGIQASFISYFVINFFNFDVFSTYMVSFLLVCYSLFLINKNIEPEEQKQPNSSLLKYSVFTVLIFIALWFVWSGNIRPMVINKTVNNTDFVLLDLDPNKDNCQKAMELTEPLLQEHSYIDNYVRLKYIDTISLCTEANPELKLGLSEEAVSLLEESKELRPYYTRTWFYSATFRNKIIESDNLTPEQIQEITKLSYQDLTKAEELSPQRVEIFLTWVKSGLLAKDYEKAEEKANLCIELNPESSDCYWAKALVYIYLEDKSQEVVEYIKKALEKDKTRQTYYSLSQLIAAYEGWAKKTQDEEYYEILEQLYLEKLKFGNKRLQDHATLAFVYRELGKYDKAREEAEIVMELSETLEGEQKILQQKAVEEFLKTLPE